MCQFSSFRDARGDRTMVSRRGANFTAAELDCFLNAVEEVMPLSATQWEDVAEAHLTRYPETGHNVASLKRKFKELYTKRVSTGDPSCPHAVRKAKRLKQAIVDLMDGTDLQSEEGGNAANDSSMPGLGEGEDNNNNDGDGGDVLDDDNGVFNDNGEHPDDEVAAANASVLNILPNVQRVYTIVNSLTGSIGGNSHGGAIYGELTIGSMQKTTNLMIEYTGLSTDKISVGSRD